MAKEKKKMSKLAMVGYGFLGSIVILIIIGATSDAPTSTSNNSSGDDSSSTKSSQPVKTTSAEKFAFTDGTHEVGTDIKPGTYRTKGGDSYFGCYWARLSGFSGEFDDIIANNGSYDNGSQVVTISKSDKGFETNGCGKWYAELTQVTSTKTSFGSGTLIVGTDITPGRYKNSGADEDLGCYWERLSGFSGEFKDIIANDNAKNTIVTIASSDKGFSSTGCGTWKRQ